MYTRLKPQRVRTSNSPQPGQGLGYIDEENFEWEDITGDMKYSDFEWETLTGSTITIEDINNNITPTGSFTVQAGTVLPGIEYILRVNAGNGPYVMDLGTGITNPNSYDTNVKPNAINIFRFIATSTSQLELEGVDGAFVTINTEQTISSKKTFATEPSLPSKSTAATNDGTKPATEAQVYNVQQNVNLLDQSVVKLTGDQTVSGKKTFNTSPVVPNKTAAATNDGTAIATEKQVYDVAQDVTTKANKVSSATADHLASLTSGGDIADSGIAKSTVELNTNKETGDVPTDSTTLYPSSHTVKKYVDDQVAAGTAGAVSDAAYDATNWDGVTGIAPSKNAVRDKIVSMDSNISTNASDISTINGKIPSAASTSNQLADKAFVNSSINSVTAYYITKNAAGDQFATYAELAAATTFYSGGEVRVPTRNDYCIVQADENHDNATTRYIYNNGWEYQYTINETPLTQAQLDALNSGITSGKVSTYDGYATGKQDTLVSGTNIKTINNETVLGSGNISINGILSGPLIPVASSAYAGRIWFDTTNNKFWKCDGTAWTEVTPVNSVNGSTGAVTVNDVKVSASAPSNPSAGTVWYDTTNNLLKSYDGTSWNSVGAVLSVNGQTGTVIVNDVKVASTAPSSPTEGMTWYDTTNNKLKAYNGTSWEVVGDGDMKYSDFNWVAKTGSTITMDLASTITPSADFTIYAPAALMDGQSYILRVNNGSTAYTMSLGTGITNPYGTDLTLTANGVDQFVFLAIGGNLELQPEGGGKVPEGVMQVAQDSPLKPKYNWYGTQAQYEALTQYYTVEPNDTVYHTI